MGALSGQIYITLVYLRARFETCKIGYTQYIYDIRTYSEKYEKKMSSLPDVAHRESVYKFIVYSF